MSALEKVLASGWRPVSGDDLGFEMEMAAQLAVRELALRLAKDDSGDDGDDDSGGKDGDDDSDGDSGGGHSSHGAYKALIKKGVKPAMAAKMCARSDDKAEMAALAQSALVLLTGDAPAGPLSPLGRVVALSAPAGESVTDRRELAARGWALKDGTYPIPGVRGLHSAAVLAFTGHGDVAAAQPLIRSRARELGVDVATLPGFTGVPAR